MGEKRLKLTDEIILACQPCARTTVVWDSELVGFGLEITPDGAKKFVLELEDPRGARYEEIGAPGSLDVAAAREQARARLRENALGQAPAPSITVAEVCDLYLQEAGLTSKPGPAANTRGLVENHIKPLLGWKPVEGLRHADGYRLLKYVSEGKTAARRKRGRDVQGGKGAANTALRTLSGALSFAVRRGQIAANPLLGVRKFRGCRPGRPMSLEEYQRLAQAVAASARLGRESPYALAGVELLMLTGCRRGEIEALTWESLDCRRGHIHFKDSKTGPKSVPIGPEAFELLEALPRPSPPSRYVLPAATKTGHVSLGKPWVRLRTLAGLPQLRLHDLRHSFAAVMLSHNETLPTVGKVLGHRSPSSTERYTHVAEAVASRAAAAASAEVAAAARSGLAELLARGPQGPLGALPAHDADRFRAVLVQAISARWLTTDQVAARTGVAPTLLAKMRAEGHGPPFARVGARVVYSEADVEHWMAQRRAAAELDKSFRRRRAKRRASAALSRASSGSQKVASRKEEGRV